ncbi:Orc1-type DNA replication protein [Natronomonas pharaonis DSM 2160]|uniref:ORC1-type DNA replication protein n=1 Tax=Natronomonas pharaonis (strain ATCC 35678 / DSM 2160 / CIP 103997 / JCM 8858 / NBRC 14720 / NCIMB 2260 / Gabara) TaxID=348780 RepID=A0A1U7ETY0_NATPD|nr:ORC1-type DNA replication protein [Natronomonas pharaonis]CAI48389.2 Orc1-type DNA replication protein [Natronomonas pharaonis DSM 2160]
MTNDDTASEPRTQDRLERGSGDTDEDSEDTVDIDTDTEGSDDVATPSQSSGSPVETGGFSEDESDSERTDSVPTGSEHARNVDGFSGDIDLEDLDLAPDDETEEDGEADEASRGLFDDLLEGEPIFENKEVLRPSYTPHKLPHREEQINNMATILVTALRGETPSNILIYGKTGTGKTASAKFVSEELETTSQKYEVPCEVQYINCEVTDTQYRVLAQLANKFIEKNEAYIESRLDELEALRDRAAEDPAALDDTEFDSVAAVEAEIDTLETDLEEFDPVPMTGWPTDRVYSTFFDAVDYHERVVVIMLDEIDKLVEKSGDDTLYNLSRMNSELSNSRVSIMGISNDLKFTDFLDPRVKSSLGEEEIVFPPYDATQLRDILQHRAEIAFKPDTLSDDVIPLCAAFAAQEHGDARRALDLLRTAGELAERDRTETITEKHVRKAQEKIELDRVVEVVRTLPTQSKLVLYATILLEKNGVHNINTGEVFNIYKRLCEEIDADVLTQRRVTDLISELDMLGIVNAVVVSKGRYGRTKEISLSVPLDETEAVLLSDSRVGEVEDAQPFVQARFDN